MSKAALIIAISMLASRILGIFREMLLARTAGVGLEKNALDLAFMIPDILNHVVSTGFLSIIFIPIFTGYLVSSEQDKGWKFFSNVLNTVGIFLLLLIIPAFIWMKELLELFTAADLDETLLERATYFGRLILPGQLFIFAGSILVAVQHTRKQFLIPSLQRRHYYRRHFTFVKRFRGFRSRRSCRRFYRFLCTTNFWSPSRRHSLCSYLFSSCSRFFTLLKNDVANVSWRWEYVCLRICY